MAGQIWTGGWASGTLGGYLSNVKLSEELRHAAQPMMRFRQFVNIKESLGKGNGDTVIFDKIRNVSTAGGTLVETTTMSEHSYLIGKGTLTVTEWGNAVPYTGKLEALAGWDPQNVTQRVLRNDMAKVLDKAAGTQFQASDVKYVCLTSTSGTLTTNGTAGGTAGSNLNAYHVKQIVDWCKKNNVPMADGMTYNAISSVNGLRGLKDDTTGGGWVDASRYADPKKLLRGECGEYYQTRFVEENNALSNALGGSYGEAVVFGADAVVEAIALPEEVRAKIPTDYGRSKGVAWYGILGFAKMWDYSTDGEEHVVHVTSL
jgi:N4-gp56 family major capsid protein